VTVDAVVIGAGPNGLVAATLLARAGWSVELLERRDVAGGAVGSVTTDRGYVHDWGSAFYGVLHTFPVLTQLGLDRRVGWAHTDVPVAAVWDEKVPAAVMRRTPDATAAGLGPDAAAWLDTVAWWHRLGVPLFDAMMGPVGAPLPLARFAGRSTPRCCSRWRRRCTACPCPSVVRVRWRRRWSRPPRKPASSYAPAST
jgi:phytoene dehydrogenase-like protein